MKNLSVVLNVVLLVAVIVLYVFHFSEKTENVEMKATPKMIVDNNMQERAASIVFVNTDSLLMNYKFALELQDKLVERKISFENDFQNKMRDFEGKYIEFQNKAQRRGFLTAASEENQRIELQKQQEELQILQEDLSNRFLNEQAKMNLQLLDTVSNYLEEYNEDFNYQFILNHVLGGNILLANQSLDITDTVIKVLNDRYFDTEKSDSK
ncbi:MAG: OmpH family outer membrane protein [Bacteroidetes bacterium]|jgi:outer membrane protein|nr:OmpH family outer membrane protein [Bacteroidota bacterium]MBT6688076.1 OmpH family outer membrane protein [Bacteroidota bacterium]MBT7142329.1 OmpH family outer membrane protein [Bacteroidota bacterium]MBT7491143.1 OmpH family outer membrane protein [Bacteroidota bacterium]